MSFPPAFDPAGRRPGSLPRSLFQGTSRWLPPVFLACSLAAVYLRTLAPGLSWTHEAADGGDLITASFTGGVPHPSGYPLYLVLAGLFQRLPIGGLAFRTNLLSAAAAVLAALLVYGLVARMSRGSNAPSGWLAGLVSAYAIGLAPLLWSQAVITEVYALHAAIVALILNLFAGSPAEVPRPRLDYVRGLAVGLGTGNHLTTLLLAPLMLANALHEGEGGEAAPAAASRPYLDRRSLLRQAGAFIGGLCIYLVLPLRAANHAPVNWGNPVTLPRLWWLVSGQLYRDELLGLTVPEGWNRLHAWAGLLLDQFALPAVTLGIAGLILLAGPLRARFVTAWCAAVFTAFAIGFGTFDSYVYLIPAFLAFAAWIGQGAAGILRAHPPLGRIVCALLLLSLFARAGAHWPEVDASGDRKAEESGAEVLQAAPPDALLFARGDRAVFTLWYFHFALRERGDVVVIAEDLLGFDWYLETLRATYPGLALPSTITLATTIQALNPDRPACYVDFSGQALMNCP